MFKASFALQPANQDIRPYLALARVTGTDFFAVNCPDRAVTGDRRWRIGSSRSSSGR